MNSTFENKLSLVEDLLVEDKLAIEADELAINKTASMYTFNIFYNNHSQYLRFLSR